MRKKKTCRRESHETVTWAGREGGENTSENKSGCEPGGCLLRRDARDQIRIYGASVARKKKVTDRRSRDDGEERERWGRKVRRKRWLAQGMR